MNCQARQKIMLAALTLVLLDFSNGTARAEVPLTNQVLSKVHFVAPPLLPPGKPSGRQQGGSSRGNCPFTKKPLAAVVPSTTQKIRNSRTKNPELAVWDAVWGLTTSGHPTFIFYVPHALNHNLPIIFVLQNSAGENIYQTSVKVELPQPGFVSVSHPTKEKPLGINQFYRWFFVVDCANDSSPLVEGWVQRTVPNSALSKSLKNADGRQRVALYAANGIWYDAISTLSDLRRREPKNPELMADWVSLLESIGLKEIATEPVTNCCKNR